MPGYQCGAVSEVTLMFCLCKKSCGRVDGVGSWLEGVVRAKDTRLCVVAGSRCILEEWWRLGCLLGVSLRWGL